jgi:MFS family permease
MLRTILAVLGGWMSVGVLVVSTDLLLTQIYPDEYKRGSIPPDYLSGISLFTSTIWSVVGGWICALIAKDRHWRHNFYLILWGLLMGVVSAVMTWGQIQNWYQIGLIVAWPFAVSLGCWIRARNLRAA